MLSPRLQALCFSAVLMLCNSAAQAGEWRVVRISGGGWVVSQAGVSARMAAGMPVAAGSTVATDPQSRAMLAKDGDTMMLGPSTTLAIPYKPDRGLSTTVLQKAGALSVSVAKRGSPHFSVQTPFLAAVVKGTVFTTFVAADGAEVTVQEGRVGVADLASGERADIVAGQSASVAPAAPGLQVASVGALPEVRAGRPQKALLAPAPNAARMGKSAKAPGQVKAKADPGSSRAKADRGKDKANKAGPKGGSGGKGHEGRGGGTGGKGNGGNGGKGNGAGGSGGGKGGSGGNGGGNGGNGGSKGGNGGGNGGNGGSGGGGGGKGGGR